MRFAPTEEQRAFASALDGLLVDAAVPSVVRAWAAGDHALGLDLWQRLGDVGLHALLVPEEHGGLEAEPVDLAVAFERLGFHAVPGPLVESVALAPSLLAAGDDPDGLLPGLAEGKALVSVAAPPVTPYLLDADVAAHALVLADDTLARARVGSALRSVDASRRLFRATADSEIATLPAGTAADALDLATLACSAQLLGAGERLLASAVDYARSRRQFGRVIGEYQAVKHALADVKVALDFARPLIYGAAVAMAGGSGAARDVSAAKVASSVAADRAARTALQVHGAIGYTAEYDLGLWITKVRALVGAWGDPSYHRGRVLASLTGEGA